MRLRLVLEVSPLGCLVYGRHPIQFLHSPSSCIFTYVLLYCLLWGIAGFSKERFTVFRRRSVLPNSKMPTMNKNEWLPLNHE